MTPPNLTESQLCVVFHVPLVVVVHDADPPDPLNPIPGGQETETEMEMPELCQWSVCVMLVALNGLDPSHETAEELLV